jgi:hypothetical protein
MKCVPFDRSVRWMLPLAWTIWPSTQDGASTLLALKKPVGPHQFIAFDWQSPQPTSLSDTWSLVVTDQPGSFNA